MRCGFIVIQRTPRNPAKYKNAPPVLVTLLAWLQELIVDFINEMNKTLMLKEAVMELYTMPRNEPRSGFTKDVLKLESASSEKKSWRYRPRI